MLHENHFHSLVYMPDPCELSDDELLARYLTPLAKSGYIAVAGGEKNRYLPGKQYRILRKGKAVVRAYPHHFYPTIRDPLTPR